MTSYRFHLAPDVMLERNQDRDAPRMFDALQAANRRVLGGAQGDKHRFPTFWGIPVLWDFTLPAGVIELRST